MATARALLELLRWHKPSGRLILLIPAGWALWLNPQAPPPPPWWAGSCWAAWR